MCIGAYREALTRQATEAVAGRPPGRPTNPGHDDPESRGVAAASAVADSGPAIALAQDATVVHGEVVDSQTFS
jgi:hypothetical protein